MNDSVTPSFAGGPGLLLSLCGLLGPLSLCLKRRRHVSRADDGRWEVPRWHSQGLGECGAERWEADPYPSPGW